MTTNRPDWRKLLEFVTYYEPVNDTWVCQAVLRHDKGRRVVLIVSQRSPESSQRIIVGTAKQLTWCREGTGKAARWLPVVEGE